MKDKKLIINVLGSNITFLSNKENNFISLIEMVKHFNGRIALIENWLKNKDSVLYLGICEKINNSVFNTFELEGLKRMW